MKKNIVSFILGILMLASLLPISVAAEDTDTYLHRSNVVFVTDESGSMLDTDPENERYEAVYLFLGEMADTGNYVGSVSFGEGIVDTCPIQHMNGQAEKDVLLADISDQEYSDYTNIGMGLLCAVELLNSGKNPELDSAIILLTDGNTTMPNKNALQESMEMKAEAIEQARQNGYKIYTICLNVNGRADSAELRQIAEATGGEFAEINSSKGLNDVETMFNKLIFHSFEDEAFSGLEFTIGSDGSVETEFTIPEIGIEELNVLFEGDLTDCTLTDLRNKVFMRSTDTAVFVDGRNFILVKVQRPAGGTWKAVAYGDPNTSIRLRLLYNSDFYVTAALLQPSELHIGSTVEITACLGDSCGIVQDISRYSEVDCIAHISCAGVENTYPMQLTSNGFSYQLPMEAEGTYYISVSASCGDMEAAAEETFVIHVNNTAPVPAEGSLSAHANIWPIIGGSASIDLTGAAIDPDGQELHYSVKSTAFNADDYVLNGSQLTIKNFSIPKGSFEIMAQDPYGANCTFSVQFTSTNVGLIMAILMLAGLLIAAVAVILGIRAAMGKALMGSLSVSAFHGPINRGVPSVINSGRGRIPLSMFSVEAAALPQGCKFQCDGRKRQIWFISKTEVYADNIMGKAKKIRISGDAIPVRISSDQDLENGIVVLFKSDVSDPLGISF